MPHNSNQRAREQVPDRSLLALGENVEHRRLIPRNARSDPPRSDRLGQNRRSARAERLLDPLRRPQLDRLRDQLLPPNHRAGTRRRQLDLARHFATNPKPDLMFASRIANHLDQT